MSRPGTEEMIQKEGVYRSQSSASLLAVGAEADEIDSASDAGRDARGTRRKPLIILVLLIGMVAGMAVVFQLKSDAVVRARGALCPQTQVELRAPTTSFSQNGGRVAEVFKRNGDSVQAGDPILRLDSQDESLRRQQAQKKIEGLKQALQDHARMKAERALKVELAQVGVRQAAAEIEAEQARLDEALALLKRAGAQSVELEVRVAKEKLNYALAAEEEARRTYENYKNLPATAISDERLRDAKLAHEKSKSLALQSRDELELLSKSDVVSRLEGAQAQVAYHRGALKTLQAKHEERQAEVRLAQLAEEIDAEARLLTSDFDRASLELQRLQQAIDEKILRAPLAGVLHGFQAQPGQWVINRQPLGWICDVSTLLFQAQVSQRDLARVISGQRARIYFDSGAGQTENQSYYDAEVLDVGHMANYSGAGASDPLSMYQPQPTRRASAAAPPTAIVRLKLLPAQTGSLERLRIGFTGQARILIGNGKLAEVFY